MNRSLTKVCTKCNTEKSLSKFQIKAGYKDGHASWCNDCLKVWRKGYEVKNKDKLRAADSSRKLMKNYGITLDEYNKLLEKQGGGCAVCGKSPDSRRLHVDHDHKTGAVRGLLCSGCNTALGHAADDVSILQRLIGYLTRGDA